MRSLSSLLLLALCCCPFASTWAANQTKYAYTHAPTVFYTSIEQGCADLTNARINDSWNITGFVFYKNNQCFYSATNVKTGVSYPEVSGQTPVYVGTCVAGESTSVSWPLGPRDTSFPNNVNPASATVPPWPVCVSGCMAEYVSVDSCFAVSEQSPVYIHCDYNAKRTGEACASNDAPPPPDVSDCPAGTVLTGTDCVAVPPVDPCIAEPTGPGCTGGGDTGGGDTGGGDTGGGDTGGGGTGGGDTGGGDTGGGDTGGGDTGGGDTGGGDTGGGDTGSAGGLGCKDPFVCSGDSVGCAMVQLQKIQRCESERGLDPELGKAGIAETLMGHGKTLNAIKEIDGKAKAEGRPVYYHNVNGLKPERLKAQWYAFEDPHKWYELPDNSIVLIDEAQRFFGVRDPRKAVPQYCSEFETMRHDGLEVHLVTQHASFLDAHIRKLCNKHIYVLRIFGGKKLSRYEAEKCIDVDKQSALKDASHSFIKLDSKFFGVYDSAVEHHFKFKPPGKLLIIPVLVVFIIFMIYRAMDSFNGDKTAEAAKEVAGKAAGYLPAVVPPDEVAGKSNKQISAAEYVAIRTPRIPDLPSSAPIYDSLTKPKTYPRLSCMISSDPGYIERNARRYRVITAGEKSYICECYTQQGTWHKTSFSFCKNSVEYGRFDPAIEDRRPPDAEGNSRERTPTELTEAPAKARSDALTVVPDSEYASRPWR